MARSKTPPTTIYAVITGDIVGSTNLAPKHLAELRKALGEAVRAIPNRCVLKGPEFFRGDSWQVLLDAPENALNLALLIQANLIAKLNVQTRAAIGIGTVESTDGPLATSVGEAFTLSGHALENISGNGRFDGALPARAKSLSLWFPALLRICGGLARSWTRRQAEAMGLWLTLVTPTHEEIAQRLVPSVTKQTVGDILASAHLPDLVEAMTAFHKTNWQFLAHDADLTSDDMDQPERPRRRGKA
jgi:hypothetical protein